MPTAVTTHKQETHQEMR